MESQRTGNAPQVIENLGDGSFHYNFNIIEDQEVDENEQVTKRFVYNQVRCNYPVNEQEIQEALTLEGYNHTPTI